MADAKKCDRCGALYDIYCGIAFVTNGWEYNHMAIFANGGVSKTFDLCPNCMGELINFLKDEDDKMPVPKFVDDKTYTDTENEGKVVPDVRDGWRYEE